MQVNLIRHRKVVFPWIQVGFLLGLIGFLYMSMKDDEESYDINHHPFVPIQSLQDDDNDNEDDEENVLEDNPLKFKIPSPTTTLKQQLTTFFQKHNPSKLDNIEDLMTKFSETELNEKLFQKYGEGLVPPSTPFPTFQAIQVKAANSPPPPRPAVRIPLLKQSLISYVTDRQLPLSVAESLYLQYKSNVVSLDVYLKKTYGSTLKEHELDQRLTRYLRVYDPALVLKPKAVSKLRQTYPTMKKLDAQLFHKYKVRLSDWIDPELKQELLNFPGDASSHMDLRGKSRIQVNDELFAQYQADLDSPRIQEDLTGKLNRYLSEFHPGFTQHGLQALVLQYDTENALGQTLENLYGARLDNEFTLVQTDARVLTTRLQTFFRSMQKIDKLETVPAAVEKYKSNLPTLNSILRSKYGVDLNGAGKSGYSLETTLQRVKVMECQTDNDRTMQRNDQEGKEENDEETDVTTTSPSSLKYLVFGLPLTGLGVLKQVLDKELHLSFASEEAMFDALLSHTTTFPKFDSLLQHDALVSTVGSFFFQEFIALAPQARILITVRDFSSWYQDVLNTHQDPFFVMASPDHEATMRRFLFHTTDVSNRIQMEAAYVHFYNRLFALLPPSRRRIVVNVFSESHLSRFFTDTLYLPHTLVKSYVRPQSLNLKQLLDNVAKPNLLAVLHKTQWWVEEKRKQQLPHVPPTLIVLSMFASDPERFVPALLFSLGMNSLLASFHDWSALFAASQKKPHLCPGCARVKHLMENNMDKNINGLDGLDFPQEDFVGGESFLSPLLWLNPLRFRVLLVLRDNWVSNFHCEIKKITHWRSEVEQKFVQHQLGFDPLNQTVSDYLLAKRYGDFLNTIRTWMPPSNLYEVNLDTLDRHEWTALCDFLEETDSRRCVHLLQGVKRSKKGSC